MDILNSIFHTQKPIIAMIHFPPLVGYKGYPGISVIEKRVISEVKILNNSGVHAIMVENNYDIPHREFVEPHITAMMTKLTDLVVRSTSLPVGIDVLWNDYKSALGICAATGSKFIRIPAFVDDVRTIYGDMKAVADDAILYRKKLGLEKTVAILVDVQVKHSEMIDESKPLSLSIKQAIKKGADGIIVTGKWTGDAPIIDDLSIAYKFSKQTPIFVGSGSSSSNLQQLFKYTSGIIVGTAIMEKGIVNRNKVQKYMRSYYKLK
jgi:uncharacterized protein